MTSGPGQLTPAAQMHPADILLVEDDPGDALMTGEALDMLTVPVTLHVTADGEQALQFLDRKAGFASAPRPRLILLDLNLPRRTGLEVLAEVKARQDLRAIPVVVLTTSHAIEDIRASYQRHANAYISKPLDFDLYTGAVLQACQFFLTLAAAPCGDGDGHPPICGGGPVRLAG
jgi:CheY-like chemotaxis protein